MATRVSVPHSTQRIGTSGSSVSEVIPTRHGRDTKTEWVQTTAKPLTSRTPSARDPHPAWPSAATRASAKPAAPMPVELDEVAVVAQRQRGEARP